MKRKSPILFSLVEASSQGRAATRAPDNYLASPESFVSVARPPFGTVIFVMLPRRHAACSPTGQGRGVHHGLANDMAACTVARGAAAQSALHLRSPPGL